MQNLVRPRQIINVYVWYDNIVPNLSTAMAARSARCESWISIGWARGGRDHPRSQHASSAPSCQWCPWWWRPRRHGRRHEYQTGWRWARLNRVHRIRPPIKLISNSFEGQYAWRRRDLRTRTRSETVSIVGHKRPEKTECRTPCVPPRGHCLPNSESQNSSHYNDYMYWILYM